MNKNIENKGLLIFISFLLLIQFFYFFYYFFISGIYYQYGYNISDLTMGIILISILLLHGLILISLFLIFYGYQNKYLWMRKFTMFYLLWGLLWGFWGLIIGNNIILHSFLIIFYIIGFYYLTTDSVKKYFIKIFKFGKYILYTRYVKLKSGRELPIFFFSSHTPKSGTPTYLPDGYEVRENPRSNMPYLKKSIKTQNPNNIKENIKDIKKKTDVVYVLKRIQTGNRGNWSVKRNNKFLSSHRTKKTAIKQANIIAKKTKSRILVQDAKGRFSYGINPNKT